MNDFISGIGIFILGILITIGAIWLLQLAAAPRKKDASQPDETQVPVEMFIIENLQQLPADLSIEDLEKLQYDLQKRYHLSAADAEETLTAVIRSSAFERVTGAKCTCYADSKQYGKYFHAPTCEYRQFLEGRGGNAKRG